MASSCLAPRSASYSGVDMTVLPRQGYPDQTRETRAAYIRGYTAGYRAALEGIRYSIEKQAKNLPYRGEQPVDNSSSTGYKPLEINGD